MANKRAYRLKTIGDVSHCLSKTVNELRRGEIDVIEARARGYLLNILLAAIKDSEIEQRLAALEKAIEEQNEFKNKN